MTVDTCEMANERIALLEGLLRALVEGEDQPCSYDHLGCCQEHGWFGEPGECGIRSAREALGL